MKNAITVYLLLAVFSLSGCGAAVGTVSSDVSNSLSESLDEKTSGVAGGDSSSFSENADNTGGEDWCFAHNLLYHTFDPLLVDYVGMDNFEAWMEQDGEKCSANIVSFVQYFQIPEETLRELVTQSASGVDDAYYEATGLTPEDVFGVTILNDEQINAIYSGDEAKVETAFAGYLAVDAEDRSRYSINWLENHSAEDYLKAGIKPESVDAMLSLINSDVEYQKYRANVQDISATLNEAETKGLNSRDTASTYTEDVDLNAVGGAEIDWDYSFSYNVIPNELIEYIGQDKFNAWVSDSSYTLPHNMQTCIEYFNLTEEQVLEALNPPVTSDDPNFLTVSDIEILCSGDQAAINRNFVSEYAALSEDGSIYTVFWLAAHTAEDYEAAGLSEAAVDTALQNCAELEIPALDEYVSKAESALIQME